MTIGVPEFVLRVINEESPQPAPPPTPVPPVVVTNPLKAVNPFPANGATSIYPGGLVLSWGNGGGADTFVIWLNGVFMGTQSGTSFTPPALAVSTTYTWRIDSLNSSGITFGDTWVFTTASQVNPPPPPSPATSPSPNNGDATVDPSSVTLSWTDGGGALSFDVYLNGVFQANQATTSYLAGALTPSTSYTWRIDSVNAFGTTVGTTWSFTTTTGTPSKAINPTPSNGSTTADPDATLLSWVDGGGALSYDVWFNGVFQGNQVAALFDPGILTSFTSYTWRIDSVNGVGTTTGDTWTFDTSGHATVVSWAGRVVTNGGAAPSTATKQALHVFCRKLDTDSLSAKMIEVNCFVPDSLIASITPLISTVGSDPWTNNNFVSGDLDVDGLKSDGINKYLNAGFQPSSLVANSIGYTIYNTTVDGTLPILGAWSATTGFSCYLQNNNIAFDISYNGGQGRILTNIANWTGYVSGNRTANNLMKVYYANSVTPHAQLGLTDGNVVPDERGSVAQNFYVFANNVNGVLQGPSTCRISFMAFHTGLTQSESSNFFDAVQAVRTALGGGFI